MSNMIRFTRGTVARDREEALRSSLNLLNDPSRRLGDDYVPPGVFFLKREPGTVISSSEGWANVMAQQTQKIPFVIDLTVTEQNFNILKGRMFSIVKNTFRAKGPEDYSRVTTFSDLEQHSLACAINLDNLPHEDLVDLGVLVGFPKEGDGFEYKQYKT